MKKVFNFLSAVSLLIVFALFYGCKKDEIPTLTTTAISGITTNSASSGGNITDDGGADVTARGVCWGTATKPTITGSKTSDGIGIGIFTSGLTDLTPNTMYYVRAYATNSEGTAYGNEISFTTNPIVGATLTTTIPSTITSTSAVSGGDITDDGGADVTERGICWATTANPTTANNKVAATGTGTGTFTASITGLQPGTVYHVQAYAINSSGTAYGGDKSFTTLAVKPSVTTAAVTIFTQTTATAGGEVTATGGADVTERGVCYGTAANPTTTTGTKVAATGTGLGTFTCNLTGLTPGMLYHVRAFAKNSVDTEYGTDVTFTTSPILEATVTTATPSAVTATTAVLGGTVTSSGGGTISARGVCYGVSANPATSGLHTTVAGTTGAFSSTVTGLSDGTVYYIRAYVTNEKGTSYGSQVQILTGVADADNNLYKTVVIGTQVWMAENLKTTKFNDNAEISNITGDGAWILLTGPAYCWMLNDAATYKNLYGGLYNGYAAEDARLCPTGWHVPSDAAFKTLETTLGMAADQIDLWGARGTDQGSQIKSTTGWADSGNGTNSSGLNAVPAGYRYYGDGSFRGTGSFAYWWTLSPETTNLWYRRLDSGSTGVYRASAEKIVGKSVRCIKN
jgi:uncharacterized protein (TIGR02145 family)